MRYLYIGVGSFGYAIFFDDSEGIPNRISDYSVSFDRTLKLLRVLENISSTRVIAKHYVK